MHKEAGGMGAVVAYTVVAAVLLHTGSRRGEQAEEEEREWESEENQTTTTLTVGNNI